MNLGPESGHHPCVSPHFALYRAFPNAAKHPSQPRDGTSGREQTAATDPKSRSPKLVVSHSFFFSVLFSHIIFFLFFFQNRLSFCTANLLF